MSLFIILSTFIGEKASDVSSLYSMGNKGLSVDTLLQLLLLSSIITIAHAAFLTDQWIKTMQMSIRYIMFFVVICVTISVFVIIFSWFPIYSMKSWGGFFVSFILCTGITVGINRIGENAENKKMEQALKKMKE